jgi:2-C-methyl-D-erythritol 4-phosphate cytidylyltransferase
LPKIEVIVPAAGRGSRLKKNISKPLVKISGSTIIARTLKVLDSHSQIYRIIILSNKKDLARVRRLVVLNKIYKVKCVALGGATRKKSVEKGLKFLDKDTDFVLIHDAVRPFVDKALISRVILKARKTGASIAGVPSKPTIKKIKKIRGDILVDKSLDRRYLWEIQTPQVFKKDLIERAYKRFKDMDATDDAYLIEKLGNKVSLVEGSYLNIKITTPEDLVLACAIAEVRK